MKSLIVALGLTVLAGQSLAETAPYAGQQHRDIKSLEPAKIAGLLDGAGLGHAKAAELNGWPGPLHALELSEELALDTEQQSKIQAIRAGMLARAQPLGAALIEAEAALNALFANGTPDATAINDATARIARIDAELRAVHLQAHIETTPLLSRHQRMIYAQERGYSEGSTHHGNSHNHN